MDELRPAPSLQTLDDLVETTFTIDGNDDVEFRLVELDTSRNVVDDWEQFTLVFDGPNDARPEGGMHRLVDADGEGFDLTMSPTPTVDPGSDELRFEAPFYRHKPGYRTDGGSDDVAERSSLGGAQLSVDQIMGGIEMFAGAFAPQGFMMCAGQRIQVSQNQALFSLLGTTYGGDGQRIFNLPDLRGRTPIAAGQSPGGRSYRLGEAGGSETVSLTVDEMPTHTHLVESDLPVSRSRADSTNPIGNRLGLVTSSDGDTNVYTDEAGSGSMDVETNLRNAGGGQSHNNMPPYLTVNYVIATAGVYPQRP